MKEVYSFLQKFGPWFTVFLLGIAIVVAALLGGIPKYFTVPSDGRNGMIIMGSVLAVIGIVGLWKQFFHSGPRESNSYGIKITYPQDGHSLKSPIEAVGTYKKLPKGDNIYSIELNPALGLYWPKTKVSFDPIKKTWSAKLSIGGGDNNKRRLIIAEMSPAGLAMIKYYRDVSTSGQHKGIADFQTGFTVLDQVTITLQP